MRTIGRLATRVALCLGFLVCLTVVGASAASAQSCGGSGSGSGSGSGCTTTTVASGSSGSTTTTTPSGTLPLTGEQAAIPLAAAAGLIVVVLGARQLRRRSNN
ncbi:MAG TPA: hypothetical protein VHT30_10350 [Acidimicrobiales bacterium]|nr:hypothetical protein [Acidimicrobiales bacterium]